MTPELNPEQVLKTGVRALKRQDYGRAISIFEELSQADIPKAYQLKAQMGLVRTYAAQQQWQQALALCQSLTQSSSSQVRDWANTKQQELIQAQQAPTADLSGFQPLAPELAPNHPTAPPTTPQSLTSPVQRTSLSATVSSTPSPFSESGSQTFESELLDSEQ
ncbi:MAG: tetratricopeptide repeat protein, partial [Cyanobacteria bacterium P01_F01_bin.4]